MGEAVPPPNNKQLRDVQRKKALAVKSQSHERIRPCRVYPALGYFRGNRIEHEGVRIKATADDGANVRVLIEQAPPECLRGPQKSCVPGETIRYFRKIAFFYANEILHRGIKVTATTATRSRITLRVEPGKPRKKIAAKG